MSRKTLYTEQGGICRWCLLPLPDDFADTDIDHIIPQARGGTSDPWNKQLLHGWCNRRKGSAFTEQAAALAAAHGITLREPKPTSWPGGNCRWSPRKPVTGTEPAG